jgi:hypothetical protein
VGRRLRGGRGIFLNMTESTNQRRHLEIYKHRHITAREQGKGREEIHKTQANLFLLLPFGFL